MLRSKVTPTAFISVHLRFLFVSFNFGGGQEWKYVDTAVQGPRVLIVLSQASVPPWPAMQNT
jgi:hypothetical protein